MSAKTDSQTSRLDGVKWGATLLLIAAAVGSFYYFADQSLLVRVVGLLAILAVAVAVALQTDKGQTAWQFARGARTEVRKVVWPTRVETMQTTMMVAVMVIIVAIILWLFDMTLLWLVKLITGQGG